MDEAHRVLRPQWICAVDGGLWPCRDAQQALLREYGAGSAVLTVNLLLLMADAMEDLGTPDTRVMYRRFVGWTLPAKSCCRVCGKRGHDTVVGVPPRLIPCDDLNDAIQRARQIGARSVLPE